MQDVIILGEHRFSRTRLRTRGEGGSYRVSANRNKMIIYFTNPEQKVQIEGAASVTAALQELEFALGDGEDW